MRYLTLLLLILLTIGVQAQDSDLMLQWDPVRNTVRGSVDLIGAVNIPDLQWYFVEAAPHESGDAEIMWTPISSLEFTPVVDGKLGVWNTTMLADGFYQIRLHAVNAAQESLYYGLAPLLVNNNNSNLVNLEPVLPLGADEDTSASAAPAFIENRLPIPLGGHIKYFNERSQAALESAGMTWVKKQVKYGESDGRDIIEAAHAQGYKVLLGAKGDKNHLVNNFDQFVLDFAEYVAFLASNGADAIEVWNEPNIDREWPAGRVSGANYTIMLKAAYEAIKSANPDTLVISGAPAPTGFFGGCGWGGCDDNVFMAQMANAGAANYADCIGVHYNEGILPPRAQGGDHRDSYPTRYLILMLERVAWPFRNADIPMCMTEIGYLSPEGYGPLPAGFTWAGGTSVAEQAEWLSEAVLIMSNYEDMPVELAIVWNVDFDTYGADPQAGYAIIREDGSCPACDAIATLQR